MYNVPFADECKCADVNEPREVTFSDEMLTTRDILMKSFIISTEIGGRIFGRDSANGEPKMPDINTISDCAVVNKNLAMCILETLNNIQRRLG